jgi:hypothetical protein
MKILRAGLITLALVSLTCSQAGENSADITLSVTKEPRGTTPVGTEGVILITVSNLGPTTASAIFRWTPTDNGDRFSYPPLEFPAPAMGPCKIRRTEQPPPGDLFGFWETRDILPGETRNCVFGYRVFETMTVSQIARWDVQALGGVNDSDESNNVAEAFFVFSDLAAARSVPFLSPWGLMALALLITLTGLYGQTRSFKTTL